MRAAPLSRPARARLTTTLVATPAEPVARSRQRDWRGAGSEIGSSADIRMVKYTPASVARHPSASAPTAEAVDPAVAPGGSQLFQALLLIQVPQRLDQRIQ